MSTEDSTPDSSRPSATLQASVSAQHGGAELGELIPMSFPGARRVAGWLFWVVFPVLCMASIVFVVTAFAGHVGKRPDGIKGTLLVTGRTCSKKICSVGGTFTSDDGKLVRQQLLADPRWHAGEKHRVVYDGKGAVVIPLAAYWDSTTVVIAGLGALTYLGAVGYFVRTGRREPQTREPQT